MPFEKGHKKVGGRVKGEASKKTIWLLESLTEHGFNYEAMLSKFLSKAALGDRHALEMAHLLVKLVPHLANAPKNDVNVNQIETLVINRFDSQKEPIRIEPTIEGELVEGENQ